MYNVSCLNPISECGLSLLSEDYQTVEDAKEAQAILVRSASMHEMEPGDGLLAVARAGAGVNNIPVERLGERGIVVFNTPGANANGVKELVVAGLLLASRDLAGGMRWVEENKGDEGIGKTMEKAKKAFAGREIQGKKLGVVGLGAIGVLVANACQALGMEAYGCDPYLTTENALRLSRNVRIVKSNEEIFRTCDYVTLHVPLLDGTRGMVGKEAFDEMRDGVVLLNFSRDLLVDDDALEEALRSGKVSKYVTDFPNGKTAGMAGVIAFPHLGASTEESEDNCAVMAVRELMDYLENGNIRNSVNYPDCDAGACAAKGRVAVCHKNVPNMIAGMAGVISESSVNIANMVNKSKGELAYTIFDVDGDVGEETLGRLAAMEEVLRARKIR